MVPNQLLSFSGNTRWMYNLPENKIWQCIVMVPLLVRISNNKIRCYFTLWQCMGHCCDSIPPILMSIYFYTHNVTKIWQWIT